MGHPVSVRLDEDIKATLEDAARERGSGLSTYLREVAAKEAKRLRREHIRAQNRAVGAYVASSAEAGEFYEDWALPPATVTPRELLRRADRTRGLARRAAEGTGQTATRRGSGGQRLFDDTYPNLILVPLTEDPKLAIADLSVRIEPTAKNGCT